MLIFLQMEFKKLLPLCVGNITGHLPFFLLLSCEGSMIAEEILKVSLA